jgi:hypothetical protein
MIVDLRNAARGVMPKVPELPRLRERALANWRGRMINEHTSAGVFGRLAPQLAAAHVGDEAVAECMSFATEERRHGVLCGAVVEALGGEACFDVPVPSPFPEHDDASPPEAALRNLVSISCMSETVAVALIGAERLEMPEGELRDLLTSIYADEIGHARFGWRLASGLASRLDDGARARMDRYLRIAFAHLEAHELAHISGEDGIPTGGEAIGLCHGRHARQLFYATVDEAIVPGLEALGLPARRSWRSRRPCDGVPRSSDGTPCRASPAR